MSSCREYWSNLNSDLACERRRSNGCPETEYSEYYDHGLLITHLRVTGERGAACIGRPIGTYLTAGFQPLFEGAHRHLGSMENLLSSLLPPTGDGPLLIVGLGNRTLAADAIGPRTADLLQADAHLRRNGIAVLVPGTTAQSGMQTADVISACTKSLKPRAVIVIDAICTRSVKRLLSTIQLTDSGITPGSGTGAACTAITRDSLGCSVIAIGVPTLISGEALLYEQLAEAGVGAPAQKITMPDYYTHGMLGTALERAANLIAMTIDHLAVKF